MIPFPSNDFRPTFSQHPPQFFLPPLFRIPPITISTSRRFSSRLDSPRSRARLARFLVRFPYPFRPISVHRRRWSILQRTASTSLCRPPPPPPPPASPFLSVRGTESRFSALSLPREFLRLSRTTVCSPHNHTDFDRLRNLYRRESRVKR